MQDNTNTTPEETQARVTEKVLKKGKASVAKNFNKLEKLVVEYIPVDMITPNDYNPNRQDDHDFELLCKSMQEDGFTTPVVALMEKVEGEDGVERTVIVDGEHRWRAAATLGLKEIPVVRVDMTMEQARISTIRHNRARGSHDIDLEAALLRDLRAVGALDIAADSLLLDDVEMQKMLDDIPAPDALAGEEYDQSWIPDKLTDEEKEIISTGKATTESLVETSADGGEKTIAMTNNAIASQRKREELIKKAKTEQERQTIQKDNELYRVSLMFSGEEAVVVKSVLGKHAAENLYKLCKEIYDRKNEAEEVTEEETE